MFKRNKFCSLFCLSVYLLVSTNCAPWLVYTGGELLFGVIYNDYACKGGECGCTSAFKCLTDCCCEKVSREGEVIAACRAESIESCCKSSEPECKHDESCCSEDIELPDNENHSPNVPLIEDSNCSPGLAESMIEGRIFHLTIKIEEGKNYYAFLTNFWVLGLVDYSCDFTESISKVPIS